MNWLKNDWWARRDSNPQPSGYEPPALTIELQARRDKNFALATPEQWFPAADLALTQFLFSDKGLP